LVFEPKPLNAIESIKAILTATFEEEPLATDLWESPDVPSAWNAFWTYAARDGSGWDINDSVSG
jgi:hypothetical protein